jgi:hypothetical protein
LVQVVEVLQFSQAPIEALGFEVACFLLGLGAAVGAVLHDARHDVTELGADGVHVGLPTVFKHIVQQARDRLVFVAAVLDHQARYREQVLEVRNPRALANLRRVGDAGVVDCIDVTPRERGRDL